MIQYYKTLILITGILGILSFANCQEKKKDDNTALAALAIAGGGSSSGASCPGTTVTRDWGTFCDMNDGTIRFSGNAGTFGGQTYTAQTIYFAKCAHGQIYNSAANDCTGTGNSGSDYGATGVQFCATNDNTCNGGNINTAVSSGALFNACNGSNLAGYSWRVPTKNEIKLTINCSNTAILPNDGSDCAITSSPGIVNVFPNIPAFPFYWSSTSDSATNSWRVDYGFGSNLASAPSGGKNDNFYVRCVSGSN